MNKVTRRIVIAAIAAAVTIPTVTASTGAASAAPTTQTVLWRNHVKSGHGNVDVTSPGITIPALVTDAKTTEWLLTDRWHCAPGAYAGPEVYYTTATDPTSHHGIIYDSWASKERYGSTLQWDFPAGTVVYIHWRMNIGVYGQAPGSGGTCSHTFRVTQPS